MKIGLYWVVIRLSTEGWSMQIHPECLTLRLSCPRFLEPLPSSEYTEYWRLKCADSSGVFNFKALLPKIPGTLAPAYSNKLKLLPWYKKKKKVGRGHYHLWMKRKINCHAYPVCLFVCFSVYFCLWYSKTWF